MSKFSKIHFADGRNIYVRFQSYVKINFRSKYSVLRFLQTRKFTTKLASINDNLDNCLRDETQPAFSMILKKQYSTENFSKLFIICDNTAQLENLVYRFFHKYHNPQPQLITKAFKACSRLILEEQNKIPLNDFSVNSVSEDMSKYWIDVPKTQTTTDDVMRIANQIIEMLDQNHKTTFVYNSYILVCGIAKRTDLAFAAYNKMLRTSITLNIRTYKLLVFACANKLDLDQAFNIIDSSIDSIFFSVRSKVWVKIMFHLGVGALVAKWLTFGLATVVQDINTLAVTGIGLSAFLSMRYAMHTIFKDIKNSDISPEIRLGKMKKPREIRKYMYIYLMSCLLKNEKFNEALIVLHQMANNEIPLDIMSFNKIIVDLCRTRNSSAALEAVIKFQEHGFRPTKQTFRPIVQSFMNHGCDKRMRKSLYNLMKDNNIYFPKF
jgi:pentatricopeptide repeat protein